MQNKLNIFSLSKYALYCTDLSCNSLFDFVLYMVDFFLLNEIKVINRPSVARAVLQTPSTLVIKLMRSHFVEKLQDTVYPIP